jgi:lysophospholipase L1-like esterase
MKLLNCRPLPLVVLVVIASVASAQTRPTTTPAAEALPIKTFQNLAAGKPQTVVVYGTSLSAFAEWPKAMKAWFDQQYPGRVTFANAAQSGQQSNWGVQQLQNRVLSKNPDLVFIEFSINDAVPRYNISIEKSIANLDSMVQSLRQQNADIDIVLQTMSTVWDTPNNPGRTAATDRPQYVEYYDAYRTYARQQHLSLVDHYPNWLKLQKDDEAKFKAWLPDGTHPIAEGSLAVTWPAIRAMLEQAQHAAGPTTQASPATRPAP